mgnify:FL=1
MALLSQARLNEMMSQIRLRQSQVGERLARADGRYVVEGAIQDQLKQVREINTNISLMLK